MGEVLRVVLVEDHEMVRDGFVAVLNDEPDFEVVGAASTVAQAKAHIERLRPDVVVTDFLLPDGDGGEVAAVAQELSPPPAVLMITGVDDRRAMEAALANGCAGFVSKGRGIEELLYAVRSASRGAAVFPAGLLASVTNPTGQAVNDSLTSREIEVLNLLSNAKNADQISDLLYLSVHTVRNHIRSILAKLNVRSQLEAVVTAVQLGIVSIERSG